MANVAISLIVEFLIWGPIVYLWSNGIIPIELVICALMGTSIGKAVADARWRTKIESKLFHHEQRSNLPLLRKY